MNIDNEIRKEETLFNNLSAERNRVDRYNLEHLSEDRGSVLDDYISVIDNCMSYSEEKMQILKRLKKEQKHFREKFGK